MPDLVTVSTKTRALRVCSSRARARWTASICRRRAVEKAFADAKKSLPISVDAPQRNYHRSGAESRRVQRHFPGPPTPASWRTTSKNRRARNRCAGSIQSITATMGHRQEVFPISRPRRAHLISSGLAAQLFSQLNRHITHDIRIKAIDPKDT
jgi:hypothetical protein